MSEDVVVGGDLLEAFGLFVREAAARTHERFRSPNGPPRVPSDELDDAALTIVACVARRPGGVNPVTFEEARREILAQAFDEYCRLIARELERSERRREVLAWMSEEAGRPVRCIR